MLRTFFCSAAIIVCLFAAQASFAGTFENDDSYPYDYEIDSGGEKLQGTIMDDSTMYGFCDTGCKLTLLNSGQSIFMEPNDYIIIEEGVMKEKPVD